MNNSQYQSLKTSALQYVNNLKVPNSNCDYYFSANTDATIFSSCFALFILDLFKETDNLSNKQKEEWINYIQKFQNKEYGYFEPKKFYHENKERNRFQLTCFCLSALGILGARPLYPLHFIDEWKTPNDIHSYLYQRGCHEGKTGSGNAAMFMAIFFIYEYERTGNNLLLKKIQSWFDFHNEYINPKTGFWGNNINMYYYDGMQNSFHQFVIYTYMKNVKYLNNDKVIKKIIKLQDQDGLFAKTPGGFGCFEYDAVDYLVNIALNDKKFTESAKRILKKTYEIIINIQNTDGGFPMISKKHYSSLLSLSNLKRVIKNFEPKLCYLKLKYLFRFYQKGFYDKNTYFAWTEKGCLPTESNLWDTWFRLLTIAQIERLYTPNYKNKFRFHKTVGIGYA